MMTTGAVAADAGAIFKNRDGNTVTLPKGRVKITEPIRIGAEYSGCTFVGDGTVIDGGASVAKWTCYGGLWSAPLPKGHRLLYRNGAHVVNNRWPETGVAPCENWALSKEPYRSFLHLSLPDRIRKAAADGAELVIYYGWNCARCRKFKITDQGIELSQDEVGCRHDGTCRIVFENMPSVFLQSGQWRLDAKSNQVLYKPLPGERPDEAEFFTTGAKELLVVDGAKDITFRGIAFQNTGDDAIANTGQADAVTDAAVEVLRSEKIAFENCRFESLSGWALFIGEGTHGNRVTDCAFRNLGSGAIHLSAEKDIAPEDEYCRGHVIERCTMADGGKRKAGCVAVLSRHAADVVIRDNTITRFPYSGISCGWNWSFKKTMTSNNLISGNRIFDLGDDDLVGDMGAIYMLGRQPGTVIENNRIRDIRGTVFCWGIYLDEGSAEITVRGNLVSDCKLEPFHVHYGMDNLITGNVFIAGKNGACCSVTRATMDANNKFEPGTKVFDFTGNLCIADGMPFYLKSIWETYPRQELIDAWKGDNNFCWQIDEDCKVKVCEDWHFINLTMTPLADDEFIAPGREEHSVFRSGPRPSAARLRAENVPEALVRLYEVYLGGAK